MLNIDGNNQRATRRALARRTFLRGVRVTLSLPLLEVMAPPMARAQTAAVPRRMFGICNNLGRLPGDPPLLVFRRHRDSLGPAVRRRMRWLRVTPSRAESRMHAALTAYTSAVWRSATASSGARLAMTVLTRRACSSARRAAGAR